MARGLVPSCIKNHLEVVPLCEGHRSMLHSVEVLCAGSGALCEGPCAGSGALLRVALIRQWCIVRGALSVVHCSGSSGALLTVALW